MCRTPNSPHPNPRFCRKFISLRSRQKGIRAKPSRRYHARLFPPVHTGETDTGDWDREATMTVLGEGTGEKGRPTGEQQAKGTLLHIFLRTNP